MAEEEELNCFESEIMFYLRQHLEGYIANKVDMNTENKDEFHEKLDTITEFVEQHEKELIHLMKNIINYLARKGRLVEIMACIEDEKYWYRWIDKEDDSFDDDDKNFKKEINKFIETQNKEE